MSAVPSGGKKQSATREQVVAVMELLSTRLQWKHARTLMSAANLHTRTHAHIHADGYANHHTNQYTDRNTNIYTFSYPNRPTSARMCTG